MFKVESGRITSFLYGSIAVFAAGLTGCASIGSPGGGLYDETPPVLKNSDPANGATQVKKQRITMRFDENIKLDNANDKLTVSPPQEKSPIIMSNAKTLTIELGDTLKPNTTYSLDLGNAVQDNNEGNPMDNLSLLFSTGDHIDSLQICGYLLNAADLEPITGAYVGIYRVDEGDSIVANGASADSIFLQRPFERAGKTDAYGAFKILGCAPGRYRMYGLVDGNTNYRYDLASEDISFIDTLISPSMDTTRIVLFSFNEGKLNRYLDDCRRSDSVHINVRFAAAMDTLPQLSFLLANDSLLDTSDLLVAEVNPTRDTLTYWIRDSIHYAADTLTLVMTYAYTDTTGIDVPRTDTIQLLKPAPKKASANDKKEDKQSRGKKGRRRKNDEQTDSVASATINYMTVRQVVGMTLDIGQKPIFETSAPLDTVDLSGLHLQYKKDSLWVDMPFRWVADSLQPRRFTLWAEPHYTPEFNYQLVVDSAAMSDIYGNPVDRTVMPFREKSPEDYAHLLFNIEGVANGAFVQLVDGRDKVKLTAPVVNGQAKFVHVPAGTYFARMVIDENNNDLFDAGNLFDHKHPEKVYYLNAPLQLRANWTVQQSWNPTEVPIIGQKPNDVKINKPKEQKEKKSKNEEYLRKMGKL